LGEKPAVREELLLEHRELSGLFCKTS